MQKMMDTSESEKKTKTLQIKTLNAFDMICRKKKFEEAFRLFTELDTGNTMKVSKKIIQKMLERIFSSLSILVCRRADIFGGHIP